MRGPMESTGAKKGKVSVLFLLVAALLGAAILATDKNLSQYQPTHEYGLAAFVVIDIVLAGLVLMKGTKMLIRVSGFWGLVQALIMAGDILTPNPFGSAFPISQTDFAKYLFGLGSYDSNHIAYLFPALIAVLIILFVLAMWEARGAK